MLIPALSKKFWLKISHGASLLEFSFGEQKWFFLVLDVVVRDLLD